MFTPLGLDHVVFRVRDQAASQRFFVDVLGCTVDHVNERISLIHLRFGEAYIDLFPATAEAPATVAGGVDHVCLSIAATTSPRRPTSCAGAAWRWRAMWCSDGAPSGRGPHSISGTRRSSDRAEAASHLDRRAPGRRARSSLAPRLLDSARHEEPADRGARGRPRHGRAERRAAAPARQRQRRRGPARSPAKSR